MSPQLAFAVLAFTSLLAIVNPLSAATVFVALSGADDARHRRRSVLTGVLTATAVLIVFAAAGTAILAFFGITTHAFKIAGGIIFFGIGSDMLQAKRSRVKATEEEEEEAASKSEIGIIPLGLPTLAGPGAITTVIALMAQAHDFPQAAIVFGAIIAVLLITGGILLVAPALLRFFGQSGLNVMTRIMGLLVMVIGVQFVIDGVRAAIGGG
jgi:multiple antibiotic resistance protein